MRLNRRKFAVCTASAVAGLAAPSLLAQGASSNRDAFRVAASASQTGKPVRVLLAQQVAIAAGGVAKSSSAATLQRNAEEFGRLLNGAAGDSAALRRLIIGSPFSREVGLPQVVDAAVRRGALIASSDGFTEFYRAETPSILDSAMSEIGSRVAGSDNTAAGRVMATAAFALAPGGLRDMTADRLLSTAQALIKDPAEKFLGGLSPAALSGETTSLLRPLLELAQKQTLSAQAEAEKFKAANLLGTGRDGFTFKYTKELQDIRMGVAFADSALALLGKQGEPLRREVQRAAQAAQSCVQLYQAATLLASSSGLGMFVAFSGVLSGSGGVTALSSVFGGGGGAGGGDQKVLDAITALRDEMRAEFRNVNMKLNRVLSQLDEALQGIYVLRMQMTQALELLRQQNLRFSSLYLHVSESALLVADNEFLKGMQDCRSYMDEPRRIKGVGQIDACRDAYGNYALALKRPLFQPVGDQPETAVRAYFGVDAVAATGGVGDSRNWYAARAVQLLGASDLIGVQIGGSPVHEPTLCEIMRSIVELKQNKFYPAGKDTRADQIRQVLSGHASFKSGLRASSTTNTALSQVRRLIREIQGTLMGLFDAEVKKVVEADTGHDGIGKAYMVNSAGQMSPIAVIYDNDFNAAGSVHPRFVSCPRGTGMCAVRSSLSVLVTGVTIPDPLGAPNQVFDNVQVQLALRYEDVPLHNPASTTVERIVKSDNQRFSAEELTRMRAEPMFAIEKLGITQGMRQLVFNLTKDPVVVQELALRKRALVHNNPNSDAYREAWANVAKLPALATGSLDATFPSLAKLENAGNYLRGCVRLGYPEAAEQSNAMQQLLYGPPSVRLPDRDVLTFSLAPLGRARPINDPAPKLPWEVFNARMDSFIRALGDVELLDRGYGFTYDFLEAAVSFERAFPPG